MIEIKLVAALGVVLGSAIGAFSGYLFKKSKLSLNPKKLVKEKYLYGGVFCYLCSVAIMILSLKVLDVIVASLLTATTYIYSLFIGKIFLKEDITRNKIIGVIFIVVGVFCVIIGI